jgi:hypothetical protein
MSRAELVVEDHGSLVGQGSQRFEVVAGCARPAVEEQERRRGSATDDAVPDLAARDLDVALSGLESPRCARRESCYEEDDDTLRAGDHAILQVVERGFPLQAFKCLSSPRAPHVTGVDRGSRLEQEQVHLLVRDGTVFDPARHDQTLTGVEHDFVIPELHTQSAM